MTPTMRTLLVVLCLLAAPIALLPTAAARHESYCWESVSAGCCLAPHPVGNPGSLPYVLVESAGGTWLATCGTADRAVGGTLDLVDCVVFNRC